MIGTVIDKFRSVFATRRPPHIRLGRPTAGHAKIVVQIALGEGSCRPRAAQARLIESQSLERVCAVVRFCARRQLPVGAWLITGLWQVPARADRLARWVGALADEAGESAVWIDDHAMPGRFRRRLQGHLGRLAR